MTRSVHPRGEGPYGLGRLLTGENPINIPVVTTDWQNPHRVITATVSTHPNGERVADYQTACGLEGQRSPFYRWSSVHDWLASQLACGPCWAELPGTHAAEAKS